MATAASGGLVFLCGTAPSRLAQAFLVGENFIGADPVCLILGDNLFYGQGLVHTLQRASGRGEGATVFGYYVRNPERYGVVCFDSEGRVTDIEEKPARPRSKYAVPGLYFYDNEVVGIARALKPSARGELEITDVNRTYLERDDLHLEILTRGTACLDTGTHEALLDAANFVKMVEERQGLKIPSPEEVAYRMRYIDWAQLICLGERLLNNSYGRYLLEGAEDDTGNP